MARSRAENYDQARDAILAKAIALFAKEGYPSASMSALAKACNLSKAGLYHYYPSKEAILSDALLKYTLHLKSLAESIAAQPDTNSNTNTNTAKKRLEALILGFLEEYRHSKDLHVVLLHDVEFLPKAHQQPIKANERDVVEVFAAAIQAAFPSKITPLNRKPLTMSLLGAINFTFAWLKRDGEVSYAQYGEWVADVWIKGLESHQPEEHC